MAGSGLTPTEYLVLDVMAARYRLGEESWTFPNAIRPALARLAERGHLIHKPGVCMGTQHAWLTDQGKTALELDQPYVAVPGLRGDAMTPDGQAETLAEAERYFRRLSRSWTEHGARSDADALVTLLAEYTRRGAVVEAATALVEWWDNGGVCDDQLDGLVVALKERVEECRRG